jgi:hypothetical protein
VRVPVYVMLEGEVFQKMVQMEARNISDGGLAFETRRRISVDAESLVVVARITGLPEGAQIKARVVHSHWDAAAESCRVGIAFTEFVGVTPDEVMARINASGQRT